MNRCQKRLLKWFLSCVMAMVGAFSACAEGDGLEVLWWQVGEWDDYSETGESLWRVSVEQRDGSYTTAGDLGVDSARIREVTTDTYLKIMDIDEYGNALDFTLDSMGVPMTWVADVSSFASGSTEYAFVIELGNYESGTWSTLAVSESVSYADLSRNDHIVTVQNTGSYDPQYATPWAPATYVVPEPDSGLLILVGSALFALKRKRRRVNG